MSFNPFSAVSKGLQWVGKELTLVPTWIGKVVTITGDAEADAATLLPQIVVLFTDVDTIAKDIVADSGADLTAAEALVAAIVLAAAQKGINIQEDTAVIAAFNAFIEAVKDGKNYTAVLAGVKKLIVDWDTFGAAAKTAIEKLEKDA